MVLSQSSGIFIQAKLYANIIYLHRFSLGCVPCRSKAPFLVHDDKAREEALLKASRAEAQAAEAAAKAVEAAKIAKAAEEVAAARQAEISAHKPQLDHIMVVFLKFMALCAHAYFL